jgi:triacylglycerol lipase
MKLNKETILKVRNISILDADIRVEEFEKHKNINPKMKNYDFEKMKELWPEGVYFQEKNLEGVLGNFEGKFVIVFRGADSLRDWIISMLFCQKTIPYKENGTDKKIKIHSGFYNDYSKIKDFIRQECDRSGLDKAIVHGHSKGAAIATLCALDLAYNFKEKYISGFVEGSPRVGNKAFVESFQKYLPDFSNFEFGSDLIPQFPPKVFGYESVGKQIHIGPERRKGLGTKKDHAWAKSFIALTEELAEGVFYS